MIRTKFEIERDRFGLNMIRIKLEIEGYDSD